MFSVVWACEFRVSCRQRGTVQPTLEKLGVVGERGGEGKGGGGGGGKWGRGRGEGEGGGDEETRDMTHLIRTWIVVVDSFSWPDSVKCGVAAPIPHTLMVRSSDACKVLLSLGLNLTCMVVQMALERLHEVPVSVPVPQRWSYRQSMRARTARRCTSTQRI